MELITVIRSDAIIVTMLASSVAKLKELLSQQIWIFTD